MCLKPLAFILFVEIFMFFGETYVLNSQTKEDKLTYVDQNYVKYQKRESRITFLERASIIIFYIVLSKIFRKLRRKIKKEHAFFSTLFISRWLITQVPWKFIRKFYLECEAKVPPLQAFQFVQIEIVTQVFYLLIFNIFIALLRYLTTVTRTFKHPKESNPLVDQSDDTENLSLSSGSDPFYSKSMIKKCNTREQKRRMLDDYARRRPFFLILCAFCLIWIFVNPFFVSFLDYVTNKYDIPNIPLQTAFTALSANNGITLPNTLMIRSMNRGEKMIFYSKGVFKRRFYISENLATSLDTRDLTSLLASSYLILFSKEGLIQLIISLVEVIIFTHVTRSTFTDHFPELSSMSRRQLTIFFPILLSTFLPIHIAFNSIHNIISHKYSLKGDEYALKIGMPITDALVKLYMNNKDITTHFRPWEILIKSDPSITARLSNIAISKLKLEKR